MTADDIIKKLVEALDAAETHLDYCGYGDSWERDVAAIQKLPDQIAEALAQARAYLGQTATAHAPG